MILRGTRGLDFANNSDVQALGASLARKLKRLRDEDSILLAEKELVEAFSLNSGLKNSSSFLNLVTALGMKKRIAACFSSIS